MRYAVLIRWNKAFSNRMFEAYCSSDVIHWTSAWLVKESDEEEQQLYGPFCSISLWNESIVQLPINSYETARVVIHTF